MMKDFVLLMSGLAVLTKNAVMPSRGVAVQECIVVPVPPLNSSEEKRTGEAVDAQVSVTAKYFTHLFDSAIWRHAEMQHGGAVENTRSHRTRGTRALWCRRGCSRRAAAVSLQLRNSQERPHLR